MEATILQATLSRGDISQSLFEGSALKEIVTELQRLLFELGFKHELQFDNYEANGIYDAATINAVKAFASKNNFQTDGRSVSNALAKLIIQRHDFLPEMYILWSIHNSDLRTK